MKNRRSFLKVLCVLEGFKTVFKESHWMSKNSHHHEIFDKTINEISDFQDNFAEEGMVIFGDILFGDIKGLKPEVCTGIPALVDLKSFVIAIMNQLDLHNNQNNLSGLKAQSNKFLHLINKFIYLGEMD